MAAYYPRPGEAVPRLTEETARSIDVPTLVFRSGASDWWHRRETSEAVADVIPNARLIEPPWPDTEWIDGMKRRAVGEQQGAFERWPLLAPQLLEWADRVLGLPVGLLRRQAPDASGLELSGWWGIPGRSGSNRSRAIAR